ncbi:MAG: type II toxin-antitoxin system RelE/ParE family toxin [Marinilabiliaceae bacterium]|nr:type II toxin-antitoxin system RelE/ParE family toxin [Marinilabiliaceae bacterium]
MKIEIITTSDFEKNFKKLAKKYPSLDNDYEILIKDLQKNPRKGSDLGNNMRKVRMAITSKNKGKRGGARVLTCNVLIDVQNTDIYLLDIYDKSDKDTASKKEILQLKMKHGL